MIYNIILLDTQKNINFFGRKSVIVNFGVIFHVKFLTFTQITFIWTMTHKIVSFRELIDTYVKILNFLSVWNRW